MPGDGENPKCPDGHAIKGIGVRCPDRKCRRFILLATEVYLDRKTKTFVAVCFLVLTTLTALLLSRSTSQVWPVYAFVSVGVVLLYATIFSRGMVLGQATWILGLFVAVWLAWHVTGTVLGLGLLDGATTGLLSRWLPPVAWILFTAYAYYLGWKHSFEAIREPGAYFLAAAAVTFGFWGVWLIMLESSMVNTTVYQIAIAVGLVLPLACIALLIWQGRNISLANEERKEEEPQSWWSLVALWLVVVAAYVILIEPLIQALAFLLGRFLPLAVGREPLENVTVTWLGGPGWRAVATSALLMIAVTLVAAQSFLEVTTEAGEGEPAVLQAADSGGVGLPPAGAATHKEDSDLAQDIGVTAKRTFFDTGYSASFIGKLGLRFVENVGRTARKVFNIAVPVVFSILSMLVVLVLGIFQDYRDHGPFFAPTAIWGTGLTTWIIVVIACGVAFELAPYHRKDAGRPMVETGAASLLGGVLYFLVSLVSVALLPLWLYPRDTSQQFDGIVPGPIYFANLLLSMGALFALVLLTLSFKDQLEPNMDASQQKERPRLRKVLNYSYSLAACVLLFLGGAALYYAFPPLQVATAYVWSPYDDTADARLHAGLSAASTAGCRHDHMLLTGYQGGMSCQKTPGGVEVSYHLFATDDQMDHWYQKAITSRGIDPQQGDCNSTPTAEGVYTRGTTTGKLACYADPAVSWLIWTKTGSHTLAIARSSKHTVPELHDLWESGTPGVFI